MQGDGSDTMNQLRKELYSKGENLKERVIQFGEGNFLRCFVDWQIDKMNKELGLDLGIVVIQPQKNGHVHLLQEQDNLYTVCIQGLENGKEVQTHDVVTSITRSINPYLSSESYQEYLALADSPDVKFIVSNTTEAGIYFDNNEVLSDVPTTSYVGKLTALLYRRFQTFKGHKDSGLIFLPCELIEENGKKLMETILRYANLWELGDGFKNWITNDNVFCCTLVDRIVPGYPKDTIEEITSVLGYQDKLVVIGEPFNMFAIKGPKWLEKEFPAKEIGINTFIVEDLAPYRNRKVRILNGLHTAMVPVAYLMGFETVGEAMKDETISQYIKELTMDEIIPNIDLPEKELLDFAAAVEERFANPFVKHYLMSISLNSVAKYKTRDLPSVLDCFTKGIIPEKLLFSLASMFVFYRGKRGDEAINLNDNPEVLRFFSELWQQYENQEITLDTLAKEALGNIEFWGTDLNIIDNITPIVQKYVSLIIKIGMSKAVKIVLH